MGVADGVHDDFLVVIGAEVCALLAAGDPCTCVIWAPSRARSRRAWPGASNRSAGRCRTAWPDLLAVQVAGERCRQVRAGAGTGDRALAYPQHDQRLREIPC